MFVAEEGPTSDNNADIAMKMLLAEMLNNDWHDYHCHNETNIKKLLRPVCDQPRLIHPVCLFHGILNIAVKCHKLVAKKMPTLTKRLEAVEAYTRQIVPQVYARSNLSPCDPDQCSHMKDKKNEYYKKDTNLFIAVCQ